ncbi:MAG: protein phosphatase 2C domain-containing protein [Bacteroidales bacterium]|nr:protein phosphatase 2C domain-containing protein [Bacteroidales bacterium]
MLIHQLTKRGSNHPDYCEDYTVISAKDDLMLFGVFDGCSSGTESHFASALTGKIIKAEFQKLNAKNQPENLIKDLLFNTVLKLKQQKIDLLLNEDELLSTVLLFLYHKVENKGVINIIGDGVININGILNITDQNNTPHYLTYYLDDINNKQEFTVWYNKEVGVFPVNELKDLTISTDGIRSYYSVNKQEKDKEKINPIDYLIKDDWLMNNKAMLKRKCNILYKKQGLKNADDLGMIRIIA